MLDNVQKNDGKLFYFDNQVQDYNEKDQSRTIVSKNNITLYTIQDNT